MSGIINDCFSICGNIIGKSVIMGIPLRLLWPLMLVLCGGRVLHFIALER